MLNYTIASEMVPTMCELESTGCRPGAYLTEYHGTRWCSEFVTITPPPAHQSFLIKWVKPMPLGCTECLAHAHTHTHTLLTVLVTDGGLVMLKINGCCVQQALKKLLHNLLL